MNDKLRRKLERQARQQEDLMTYYRVPGIKSISYNKRKSRQSGAELLSSKLK